MQSFPEQPQRTSFEHVELEPCHPGFSDPTYRERRNALARLASEHDGSRPIPMVSYTSEEHAVWRTVLARLAPLHERYACESVRAASTRFPIERAHIPQLADVSRAIERETGFTLAPVAGLVPSREFLGALGRGVFLATQYVRHPSRPLYTPEPDVIHELVGHAATLADPVFANLSRAFGEAASRTDAAGITRIERLYWHTLEFGVVREEGRLAVCGAGLLSSVGEIERFERDALLLPFDIATILRSPYDPAGYQDVLFVAESFEEMVKKTLDWLSAV
jgi:phenylalanine-4-hydroxylase